MKKMLKNFFNQNLNDIIAKFICAYTFFKKKKYILQDFI